MKIILLLSLLGIAFSSQGLAQAPLTPGLQSRLNSDNSLSIVIRMRDQAHLGMAHSVLDKNSRVRVVYEALKQTAEASQKELISFLVKENIEYKKFFIENTVVAFNVSHQQLEKIQNINGVQRVGFNAKAHFSSPFVEKRPRKIESHIERTKVEKVWNDLGVRGEGIVLAGQDTGIYWQHNSIKKKYRGYNNGQVDHNYNWHDSIHQGSSRCANSSSEPCDDHNHGTHTVGTMVGDDENGNQIGVAPNSQWIGCRNMKDGVGTVATYLECFEYFLAPYPQGGNAFDNGKPELAPHIVNNSWACPVSEGCADDEFINAVAAYRAAGIMLVVAATNDGPGCGTVADPPAIYAGDVLAVGAYNRWMSEIAYFSSRGPSSWEGRLAPNLIAPGTSIRSSIKTGPNAYNESSGTSMASPQLAGIVALLWSYKPELIGQIDATIDILQKTATPIKAKKSCPGFPANQIPNAEYGYGMVDAYKALTL